METPLFTDFQSIMKAAEIEAESLKEPSDSVTKEELSEKAEVSQPSQPTNQLGEVEKVDGELKNVDMSTILNQLSNLNTNDLTKIMEDSMNQITPEMMEQARRLTSGGQGEQLMKEMQRRGMNPQAMRSELLKQRNSLKGYHSKKNENTKQVIHITRSRQIKERSIPNGEISAAVATILRIPNPVELSCSRLARGPLSGQVIKLWYNPEESGKNRLSSKIIGFPIGGEAVIVSATEDLTENQITSVLNELN